MLDTRSGRDILILTNSDQIEQLESLVRGLPKMHFHIAARTLMSDRLLLIGQYTNVTLYPGIREADIAALFLRCTFYLDINYYQEIFDAAAGACRYGLLILGYDVTVHHKELVLPEYLFRKDQTEEMIRCMDSMYRDKELLEETIGRQQALLAESLVSEL